jgi:hypothetical protein
VNKSYPLLGTKVEESGEHLIVGACVYIVCAPYIIHTHYVHLQAHERRDASEGDWMHAVTTAHAGACAACGRHEPSA